MSKLKLYKRYWSRQLFTPREEEEMATYLEIKEGVNFKGYNLWILGFAMVMACIGLITDSISAVIGAMLISPLMGPIVGLAFGMAINDVKLKKDSLRNWVLMTTVSLLSATLFFLLSPFDHSTILLATFKKASIFDILLAFFGGLAGFIGIVKKEGTKIIAGVAIATACMPPLCTAAYGIAHLDYKFFIGGMYFYIINSMFIGWATFLLTRYFKFTGLIKDRTKIKHIFLWDLLIIIMLIPGTYIAYQKWKLEENKPIEISDKEKIEKLTQRIEQLEQKIAK